MATGKPLPRIAVRNVNAPDHVVPLRADMVEAMRRALQREPTRPLRWRHKGR